MTDIHGTTEVRPKPDGAIDLPSGGWALLSDPDEMTGKERRYLRESINQMRTGMGDLYNDLLYRALAVRVVAWEIPGKPNWPLPHTGVMAIERIRAKDLEVLEDSIRQWARVASGIATNDEGGEQQGEGAPPAND